MSDSKARSARAAVTRILELREKGLEKLARGLYEREISLAGDTRTHELNVALHALGVALTMPVAVAKKR